MQSRGSPVPLLAGWSSAYSRSLRARSGSSSWPRVSWFPPEATQALRGAVADSPSAALRPTSSCRSDQHNSTAARRPPEPLPAVRRFPLPGDAVGGACPRRATAEVGSLPRRSTAPSPLRISAALSVFPLLERIPPPWLGLADVRATTVGPLLACVTAVVAETFPRPAADQCPGLRSGAESSLGRS